MTHVKELLFFFICLQTKLSILHFGDLKYIIHVILCYMYFTLVAESYDSKF